MYPRNIRLPQKVSFFLFGPRGVGKSTFVREHCRTALFVDLLKGSDFQAYLRDLSRLEAIISAHDFGSKPKVVVIDEIQRIPEMLNEVHRLIESLKIVFVLTGSSARKLRRAGVNLLAGRARKCEMFPLTASELGSDFDIKKSLQIGHLPEAYTTEDPHDYLKSYLGVYLQEEIVQEAQVRDLPRFAHFLEAAAFSQASLLNVQGIASDCGVDRKTIENYFTVLEDLFLGVRVPVFQRRAKRKLAQHPKFYFFDTGIFRTLRKQGPLDPPEQMEGSALETLVFQELRATNANLKLEFELSHWRTSNEIEIDFILYGPNGLLAIEVKRSSRFRKPDLKGLEAFLEDYPEAKGFLVYLGTEKLRYGNTTVVPIEEFLKELPKYIGPK